MKIKDVLSKIILNKASGQLITSIKKKGLRLAGLSTEEFFDLELNIDKEVNNDNYKRKQS